MTGLPDVVVVPVELPLEFCRPWPMPVVRDVVAVPVESRAAVLPDRTADVLGGCWLPVDIVPVNNYNNMNKLCAHGSLRSARNK